MSVVCADYKMTGMSGLELLHVVRERWPRTAGVLITGMRENLGRSVIGDEAVFAVIYKPYEAQRLIETLRDAARTVSMTFSGRKLREPERKVETPWRLMTKRRAGGCDRHSLPVHSCGQSGSPRA